MARPDVNLLRPFVGYKIAREGDKNGNRAQTQEKEQSWRLTEKSPPAIQERKEDECQA